MHKRREEVAEILARATGVDRNADIPALTAAARAALRKKFLSADMGISGANFLIAETGSSLIVTNEGNGRMTTTLPRVHVTLAGGGQNHPALAGLAAAFGAADAVGDRAAAFQTMCRSQPASGGRGDSEGPEHSYVILLDNGRSRLRGGELQEMLRCIRCGACMNHCPVYYAAGAGSRSARPTWGRWGKCLPRRWRAWKTPRTSRMRPHVRRLRGGVSGANPLPDLMRRLREQQAENEKTGSGAFSQKALTALWSFCARRPAVTASRPQSRRAR